MRSLDQGLVYTAGGQRLYSDEDNRISKVHNELRYFVGREVVRVHERWTTCASLTVSSLVWVAGGRR